MRLLKGITAGIMIACFLSACAPRPALRIDYTLPKDRKLLNGMAVALDFMDVRADTEILGNGVRKELKNFSGQVSVSVDPAAAPELISMVDMERLITLPLSLRLKQMGAHLVDSKEAADSVIQVGLKEFKLIFEEEIWKVNMTYYARLIVDQKEVAKETIQGSGERVKIMGSYDADSVFSDIYTDVMNKLNIESLYQRGGVIP